MDFAKLNWKGEDKLMKYGYEFERAIMYNERIIIIEYYHAHTPVDKDTSAHLFASKIEIWKDIKSNKILKAILELDDAYYDNLSLEKLFKMLEKLSSE